MIVQARHCKHCRGIFLPVLEQLESSAQCPHCSGQMKVGECAPAEVAQMMPVQEYQLIPEEEEQAKVRAARQDQWMRRTVWALVAGAALLGTLMALQHWNRDSEEAQQRTEKIAVLTEVEKAAQRERAEIEKVVRRIFAAKTMESLLPEVAGAEQVKGLMAWYTNRLHPVTAEPLKRVESVDVLDTDGREIRRVGVSTEQRPMVWLIMVREDGNWKLDWEMYSMAHAERWHAFLREAPGSAVELPLLIVKKPAPDNYIVKAGAAPETHDAVLLCAQNRNDAAGAVLPRDAPEWRELPGIGFEDAVKVIGRVTLLDGAAEPPLVRLEKVVQRGWIRGTQKPVAGNAPRQ
jgi:hypothetical protein